MNALFFPNALMAISENQVYLYLQLVAVFTLVILLIMRELVNNVQTPFARILWRATLIGIVPLLFAFLLIMGWHLSYAQ